MGVAMRHLFFLGPGTLREAKNRENFGCGRRQIGLVGRVPETWQPSKDVKSCPTLPWVMEDASEWALQCAIYFFWALARSERPRIEKILAVADAKLDWLGGFQRPGNHPKMSKAAQHCHG